MERNKKGQFIKQYSTEELSERQRSNRKEYANTSRGRLVEQKARAKHRERRRQYFFDYKKGMSCVYCGENNPLCIDMDHIDPSTKKFTPSTAVTNGTSWQEVLEELNKCQPVCRNCHGIKSIIESGKLINQDIDQYVPDSLKEVMCQSYSHIYERELEK